MAVSFNIGYSLLEESLESDCWLFGCLLVGGLSWNVGVRAAAAVLGPATVGRLHSSFQAQHCKAVCCAALWSAHFCWPEMVSHLTSCTSFGGMTASLAASRIAARMLCSRAAEHSIVLRTALRCATAGSSGRSMHRNHILYTD